LLPAEELFWLTNAYVAVAIIIALACGRGLALDSIRIQDHGCGIQLTG